MSRPWTEAEVALLGAKPDYEIGRLSGRPGKAVWAKRQVLGIAAPATLVRRWTEAEDQIVLSKALSEATKLLNRTKEAVKIRKGKLPVPRQFGHSAVFGHEEKPAIYF